jgi:uncharacterized protein YdeI (YjbR/CyaY-like superfamily)
MNPKVDWFFEKPGAWQKESQQLRTFLLEFPLEEELKWGKPCYTREDKNIVLIGKFKEYCALLFFKGALLPDPDKILSTPGTIQAGRQIRFTSLAEIVRMKPVIKRYVTQAIEVEQKGLKVKLRDHSEYVVPEELQKKLDRMPKLKKAFQALTPGRQRGYMLYISGAKQAKTRETRVEKCLQPILDGKGLDD